MKKMHVLVVALVIGSVVQGDVLKVYFGTGGNQSKGIYYASFDTDRGQLSQAKLAADACVWEFGGVDHREVPVQTISLNDLLDQHGAPDEIDYMSVDTEGSELEILKAFDFDRRLIRLFTIEHNFTPLRQEIHELMTAKGYVRRFPEYTRFDDWYVHRSLAG